MALNSNIKLACTDNNRRGGLKRLWVIRKKDDPSFSTGTDHAYQSISLSGTAWLIEFEDKTGGGTSEGSKDNGSDIQELSFEFIEPKMEKVKAQTLNNLKQGCDYVIVFEDYNGKTWVAGYDETLGTEAALTAMVDENTGTALQDQNGYTLRFEGEQADLLREFTGDTTSSPFEQP